MVSLTELLDVLATYNPESDLDLVRKVYTSAESAYAGMTLLNGAPYISHPLAVAHTLAGLRLDAATVAAGLLNHTVPVDNRETAIKDIKDAFWEEVVDIVEEAAEFHLAGTANHQGARDKNVHKMLLARCKDIRALILALADFLQTMRAFAYRGPHRLQRVAREIMDVYAPLANHLGLHRMELELEDLCFRCLQPDVYARISDWLKERRPTDEEYISEVTGILRGILDEYGIQASLKSRIKQASRVFHTMTAQNLDLDEVPGIIVFRIIVQDKKDCYAALGLVHDTWKSLPGRIRDYISMPKANGYQSLHTTVIGPGGKRMEVQIRTEEMDRLAEDGPIARWGYAEGCRRLRELPEMENDSGRVPRPPLNGDIYVFTPKGAARILPKDATPVDFAYQIHTEMGNRCVGAKVNHRLAPLSTELHSGDIVEIFMSAKGSPRSDWLEFVKTDKARARIRRFIRMEEQGDGTAPGRETLEK